MRFRTLTASVAAGLLCAAVATAAAPRHWEGAVTSLDSAHGQMVVCTFQSPYACNMMRIYRGTRVVSASTGRAAHLARGEFVDVDASPNGGQLFATRVSVFANKSVRAITGFKTNQSQRVATALSHIHGVSSVSINPSLGEALITFNTSATSAATIDRLAARNGIHLTLPG